MHLDSISTIAVVCAIIGIVLSSRGMTLIAKTMDTEKPENNSVWSAVLYLFGLTTSVAASALAITALLTSFS